MDILVTGDEAVLCWSCEARAEVAHLGGRALLDCKRCGVALVDPWWKIQNVDGGLWQHPTYLPLEEEELEGALEDLPEHIPDSWGRQQDWIIDTIEALLFREPALPLRSALLERVPALRFVAGGTSSDLVWRHIAGSVSALSVAIF